MIPHKTDIIELIKQYLVSVRTTAEYKWFLNFCLPYFEQSVPIMLDTDCYGDVIEEEVRLFHKKQDVPLKLSYPCMYIYYKVVGNEWVGTLIFELYGLPTAIGVYMDKSTHKFYVHPNMVSAKTFKDRVEKVCNGFLKLSNATPEISRYTNSMLTMALYINTIMTCSNTKLVTAEGVETKLVVRGNKGKRKRVNITRKWNTIAIKLTPAHKRGLSTDREYLPYFSKVFDRRRGHYKDYSGGKGLFGKNRGMYWFSYINKNVPVDYLIK